MKTVLATLNAKYIHSSLALYYVRAFCETSDNEFAVKEYSVNNHLLDILSDIYGEQPDVIGLACYIWNIEMTLQLAALIRKVLPETRIILGGPEVSYDGEAVMAASTAIDYIIKGEGEETFAKLLDYLGGTGTLAGMEGLTYRQEDGTITAGKFQVVQDINLLPFPYSNQDMVSLKDKIIYYETSRGCPFSCQYCLSSTTQGVRFLALPRIMEELQFFIDHDVKQVKFVDRTFNAHKEHYLPLIKFLAAQQCNTNFHFEIAADILDDETIDVLVAAPPGRFQLEIGIQSTHEPTLKIIQRKNNWPCIVDNVKKLREPGNIHLHLDLIAGLPQEDYQQFGKSFDNVFALQPHMLQLGFLKLLKGSGIRRQAASHEYVYMDTAPYEVLANQYITYREIRTLKLLEEVLNQTYNSGRFLNTLTWFIEYAGSAFAFFEDFTAFWEQRKLQVVSHSAKSMYKHLADYAEYKKADMPVCLELLKFDALTADNGSTRPEFLPWNGEEWDEPRSRFFRSPDLAAKYIPGYTFNTWRQIKKQYHIELFNYDVTCPAKPKKGLVPLLFIYQNHTVDCIELAIADLLPEGTEHNAL